MVVVFFSFSKRGWGCSDVVDVGERHRSVRGGGCRSVGQVAKGVVARAQARLRCPSFTSSSSFYLVVFERMKLKALSRSEIEWNGKLDGTGSGSGPRRFVRNNDPKLHPFERAREEKRSLNAAKLGRVFAKPFMFALEGHQDGVYCFARSRKSLSTICSGSADGTVKVWNLSSRSEIVGIDNAHKSFVRGVSLTSDGNRVLSCGDDKVIRSWNAETGKQN